jgi:hypothetical protein
MIGKIILPWFGGAAAVWSTCLLFFQAALLAGYLYAHCSTRYLKPRQQAILHIGLMAVSLALLPIIPLPTWKPVEAGDPSVRILLLLTATIGLPYVLLSTTSPLLQAWYVAAKPLVRSFESRVPARVVYISRSSGTLARDPDAGGELVGCLRHFRGGVLCGGMERASSRSRKS